MSDPKSVPARRSGSEQPSEPEYLLVGRITRPHGVRGDVQMKLHTAYPERLAEAKRLFVGREHKPHDVETIRSHRAGLIVRFAGFNDRDAADALRNRDVYVHLDDAIPLEDGEYYLFQIEGMRVVTDTGEELGRLTDFFETGANDVYIVTTAEGKEILLPAIPDVILKVDVPAGVMTVHLLKGLI